VGNRQERELEKNGRNESNERTECGLRLKKRTFLSMEFDRKPERGETHKEYAETKVKSLTKTLSMSQF
jgi:hypothetical protein